MSRPWICRFVMVLCAGLIAGCATAESIRSARAQLAKAKDAGAVWSAPYEYHAAEAYLGKAVFSAEIGDPHQARIFSNQSKDHSAKALEPVGGGTR